MLRTAAPTPPLAEPVRGALDQRVALLIAGLGTIATAALVADLEQIGTAVSTMPGRVATLIALTIVLQMFSVPVYGRASVSVSAIGILTCVFVLDTGPAMAIAAIAAAAQWLRTRPQMYKGAFDVSNYVVSAGVASLVYTATREWRIGAALVAGLAYAIVNNGTLCLAMSLSENTSFRTV
jgi:hypothetical protein